MKKMNKFLCVIAMFVVITNCVASQNDMPQLNEKNVKITREKIGDITILHFIDPNTGKEIYTKNVTPSPTKPGIITTSTIEHTTTIDKPTTTSEPLTLSTPTLNQPYFKYSVIIVTLIIVAIIIWQLGKDNTKGEKK